MRSSEKVYLWGSCCSLLGIATMAITLIRYAIRENFVSKTI